MHYTIYLGNLESGFGLENIKLIKVKQQKNCQANIRIIKVKE